MSLGPHEFLHDPIVLSEETTVEVMVHCHFCRRNWFRQTTPHRIVIVRNDIKLPGMLRMIEPLIKEPSRHIRRDKLMIAFEFPDDPHHFFRIAIHGERTEFCPIELQGWVVRRDCRGRHRDFVESVIRLPPEDRAPALIELVDRLVFILKECLEPFMTLPAVALITAFVTELIVNLPDGDARLLAVVLHELFSDARAVGPIILGIEAILPSPPEAPREPPLIL